MSIESIARWEVRTNWQSAAWRWAAVGLLVAMAVSLSLMVDDYRTRKTGYDRRDMEGQTRAGKRPKLTPSPTALSVIVRGLEAEAARMFIITWSQPRRQPGATILDQGDRNPLLSLFPAPDPAHLVKFAMSLLALFLAYDTICGERQRGTLQLIFAGPVRRSGFFAGKVLGVHLSVALALLPAAALGVSGLYVALAHGLDAQSWYRVLLMLLTTAAYLMLFANLGVWASALVRRPSAALMLGLAFWTVWMIGVPNLATHLARWLSPVPSVLYIEAQKSQLRETDFDSYIDYANACWAIDDRYIAQVDEQTAITKALSRLSPMANYTYGMSALAGTGLEDSRRFRDEVIDWDRRQRRTGYNWEGEIPFDPPRLSFRQSLGEAIPDLVCLLLWDVLFFLLGLFAFTRSDIAGRDW